MKNKYIDGHAHLNTKFYKENLDKTLQSAKVNNVVKMIMPGTCVEDSLKSIQLAKQYDNLYAAVGIHPNDGWNVNECEYLHNINPDDVVAVGEVGIDLYRTKNPTLEIQKQIFEKHIIWAKKNDKVLIIHMRNSEKEVVKVLNKYLPLKFVIHSFTSSYEWALKFIKMGGYISFSGIVTFKNAKDVQKTVCQLPLNSILTETDAPFLTPVPKRGKNNVPAYVKYTTDFIANHRQEPTNEVINQIYQNTVKLYNI